MELCEGGGCSTGLCRRDTTVSARLVYKPGLIAFSLDLVFVEDAKGEGLVVGFGGGGDSGDVFEFSLAEELVNVVDGVLGSGVGAEAEHHAGLDILDGLVGGDFLEVVLGEDDEGGGGGGKRLPEARIRDLRNIIETPRFNEREDGDVVVAGKVVEFSLGAELLASASWGSSSSLALTRDSV
ncbi:hypothetical protein JHK85_009888 [Glycine max]|nr:hypothetical protein JHK85_009888 [Glycine max]